MTKVLVVDDSPVDRRLAGGLLEKRGFTPIYAANGRQALALLAQDPPDIVVTDLQMPEMDGLTLVEAIRKSHPMIPVLLMTAHGSEDVAMRALRRGAVSYVPKRKLAKELAATVATVLEMARGNHFPQRFIDCSTESENGVQSQFVLDNDVQSINALLGYLEASLLRKKLWDETGLMQIQVALREALVNAIFHGNLELSSELKEQGETHFHEVAEQRRTQAPYRDRRVRIEARETSTEAIYIIGDDGPGFDPGSLPDPTDAANLEKASGRGLFLIRAFMDEVRHNARGNEITMVKRCEPSPEADDKSVP